MPYFFMLFLFILIANLIGIFTFSYTITSLLVVPFFLSFINFVFTGILMLRKYGLVVLAGFLPSGTNLIIAPLLIIIEGISYFIKLISLAVRLFANMFAGHILIKVLLSLA
jgi:F-type H+-transporting ATPase subunit a